jgi:hypothetical protein
VAISNLVAHTDAKQMVFPRKERAKNKIDSVTGRAGCSRLEDAPAERESLYLQRS